MSIVTVIKQKNKWIVGADTQSSKNNVIGYYSKVFEDKDSNAIIGYTGVVEEGELLRIFNQETKIESATTVALVEYFHAFSCWVERFRGEWQPPSNDYIIVKDGLAFSVMGFMVDFVQDFAAIGSGESFALAAFEMGANTERAIEIACKFDLHCNLPCEIYSMKAADV